ncbi:MAG: AAA-like domain-containing protein [Byssovorax sp.]
MIPRARRFQGGGVLLGDALYIERSADRALLDLLLRGEATYVLGPRQVGKSNLRMRVERNLHEQGVRCSAVDLSGLDLPDDADTWYYGILTKIARDLGLPVPLQGWDTTEGQPAAQRFVDFLRDGVMARVPGRLVLFFDEIDATYALPFSRDTFFLALRSIYQERGRCEEFLRLTFCLVGVSRPADLVEHKDMTALNLLQQVFLEDFTLDELRAMLPLLETLGGDPERLLRSVFSWTHGHPAMTQHVCSALSFKGTSTAAEDERVRAIVEERYLARGAEDAILGDVARRFTRSSRTLADIPAALALYRRILKGERITVESDPAGEVLRLVGLAANRHADGGTRLVTRNRIFAQVFDLEWIRAEERARPIVDALFAWLDAGRDSAYLLRGKALIKAQEWAKDRADLTADERGLIDASTGAERAEAHARGEAELAEERRKQAEARAALEQQRREQAEEKTALEQVRHAQVEKEMEARRLHERLVAIVMLVIVGAMIALLLMGREIGRQREQDAKDAKATADLAALADKVASAAAERKKSEASYEAALKDLAEKKQHELEEQKTATEEASRDAKKRVEAAQIRLDSAKEAATTALDKERDLNNGVVNMLTSSSNALLTVVVQANDEVGTTREKLRAAQRENERLIAERFTRDRQIDELTEKLRVLQDNLVLLRMRSGLPITGQNSADPTRQPPPRLH